MTSTALLTALRIRDSSFWLEVGQEISGQANGVLRVKDLRPALWRASIQSTALSHSEFLAIQAQIHALDGSFTTFYCWNPAAQYPIYDPTGSIVTPVAASVKINSINADNQHLSLKGLPAGYRLAAGEFLAFDATGSHRHLYQALEAVTANGSGVTAEFGVRPSIRSGAAVNDVVELRRPAAEMMIMPDSLRFVMAAFPFRGVNFEAIQVF